MHLRRVLTVWSVVFVVTLAAAVALAQKNPLVGTWNLVSESTNIWGANPKGQLVFLDNGRYSLTIMRSDLPKFAANNRTQGTAEENKAIVAGVISHFGRYTVSGDSFTYIVESSSFPNWNGTEQKRAMKLSGDELQYTNPTPSAGGAPATLVWKRAK